MLAVKCPACGAPAPLSLAERDRVSCSFCGKESAPSEAVRAELEAAAAVLDSMEASERQVRGSVGLTLVLGRWVEVIYGGFVFFFLFQLALLGLMQLAQLSGSRGSDAATAVIGLVALAPMIGIVAVVAALTFAVIRRARRRVERAAAAVPPLREGESCRCHVCGAPLQGEGVRGVVRCGHCASDNVVAKDVLARASRERVEVMGGYAAEVRKQAVAVGRSFGFGGAAFVGVVAVTPFLCVIPVFAIAAVAWMTSMALWVAASSSGPPTPGNRYGLVDVPGEGRCVAWYNPYEEAWQLGARSVENADRTVEDGVVELPLAELTGRRLRHMTVEGAGCSGIAAEPHWGFYIKRDSTTVAGPDTVHLSAPADAGPAPGAGQRCGGRLWEMCLADDASIP